MKFLFFITFLSFNYVFAQNIILEEDFEIMSQDNLPELWSQYTLSTDGGWLHGSSNELQSDWWSIEPHGNFIATNDDACDCDKSEDYLILPPLDFNDIDNAILSFASFFS